MDNYGLIKLMNDEMESSLLFCKRYKYILLYGAGNFGYLVCSFLQDRGIEVSGFIDSSPCNGTFMSKPVYYVNDIPYENEDIGIILSLSSAYHQELMDKLHIVGVSDNHIFVFDEALLKIYRDLNILQSSKIKKLYQICPPLRNIESKRWNSICVICNDGIGDLIMTTPFLRELRRNYPQSRVVLVTTSAASSLFEECPYINSLYIFHNSQNIGIDDLLEKEARFFAEKNLFQEHFDVAFIPGSYVWIAVNTYLAVYAKIPVRIGVALYGRQILGDATYNQEIECLYSLMTRDKEAKHEVERRLDLLRIIGKNVVNNKMELWMNDTDEKYVTDFLINAGIAQTDFLVALVPVASGLSRCWDIGKMLGVLRKLIMRYENIRFILLGSNNTKAAERLFCTGLRQANFISMVEKTSLRQAAALVSVCKMYLGMNTGLMSVAAAFGVPVVEICVHPKTGSDAHDNSPLRYRAFGVPDSVVRPEHGLDDCVEGCTKNRAHCINQITVDEVYEAAVRMIEEQHLVRNSI